MKQFNRSRVLDSLPEQFFSSLVKKVTALSQSGADVINLGQGSPDQPTPPHIVKALSKASENPLYHRYPPFSGFSFLKEAISTYYKREYGVEVDPENEVAILFGGKAGLVEISQCLLNEGDTALVPDPGYPDYWSGIAMAKAKMKMMPLKEENNFLPAYEDIDPQDLDHAKLMFLNYPNNPTGAVANAAFFDETVKLANKYNICVVHDFAYGALGYDGVKPVSFLEAPGAKEVGIEIYTLSKTYNMAGWRIGFAIGNPSVIESINLIQDHFYVSLFGAIQEAASVALLSSQECVKDLVQMYTRRRNVFINGLKNIGWDIQAPKGSFFAWLPIPNNIDSVSFANRLLNEAHVAVAAGLGFGQNGEGYVRIGLLDNEQRLLEAVERIKKLNLF